MLGFFYGDIVSLDDASGLCLDQQAGGESAKEMNSTTPPVPPPAPAAPAPAAGEIGDRPADELPTPPSSEGAEAGAGYPAPCEGAVSRPAASKPGRWPLMKNKASMSISNRSEHDLNILEPGISNVEHAYVRITWDNALEKR